MLLSVKFARNGKIASLRTLPETGGRRLRAARGACRLVRPGAAPERGTGFSAVTGVLSARHMLYANAGGTAEGGAFRPKPMG